jgi:AcrR family transcriptional regulator
MADETPTPRARPGLRERKKAQTRALLAKTAHAMFDERGFASVTVAEIADAANVSVKTLFKYFATKEDLFFSNENELRDRIIAGVRNREPGQSILDSVRQFLLAMVCVPDQHVARHFDGFQRSIAGNATLQGRLTLMWERYEIALAEVIRQEAGHGPHDPSPRLVAAQIISLFRLLASEEVHAFIQSQPGEHGRALVGWVNSALDMVGGGIQNYAIRPPA